MTQMFSGYWNKTMKLILGDVLNPLMHLMQLKHWTQEETGQLLYLEHFIVWLRSLDSKKVGEVFAELRNLALEENEKERMDIQRK